LQISQLVSTAWASASTFRGSDMRGGANGARIRLEPQLNWEANEPAKLGKVLQKLEVIQKSFNSGSSNRKISMADLIVLGGCAAVESAAKNGGYDLEVPFTPGRTDATQEQTDIESSKVLEPFADAFRNYAKGGLKKHAVDLLVDKAQLLRLTTREMTVLLGGLRVIGANFDASKHGVFTKKTEVLSTDFFTNLLDMTTVWKAMPAEGEYEGHDRTSGALKWTATNVDLIFGSNSELRAVAEVYAQDDGKQKFAKDFVHSWNKVMNADRYDLLS